MPPTTNRQLQIDQFVLLAHQLAFEKLKAMPQRLSEVTSVLLNWQKQHGQTRSSHLWHQWESLLSGSILELEKAITRPSDHATLLRSVSPMSVLITPLERTRLLKQVRGTT